MAIGIDKTICKERQSRIKKARALNSTVPEEKITSWRLAHNTLYFLPIDSMPEKRACQFLIEI